VGDVIHVAIFDPGGGLFGSVIPAGGALKGGVIGGGASGNQLPPQSVDGSGEITVPYAGRVPVKGRSPHAVELEIAERLKGKAADPQVMVTVGERFGGNLVTVTGDVKNPREIPLGFAGTRLIDALTASGGSTHKPHDTLVSVIRGSQTKSDLLAEILAKPAKNVALQSGDTIVVKSQQRTFLAFGATGRNGRFALETDQVTLAEAMAQTSGPMDSRSDPSAIYVYRLESQSLVRKLGHTSKEVYGGESPVIYRLNMVEPEGFFLARNFEVQDKDIIYYANARGVGLNKFLGLISTVTTGARGAIGIETGLLQAERLSQ
jgi:polysaccharide export outer membrane protein